MMRWSVLGQKCESFHTFADVCRPFQLNAEKTSVIVIVVNEQAATNPYNSPVQAGLSDNTGGPTCMGEW